MEFIEKAISSPVTLGILILTGLILFTLAVREIMTWFLKLNHFDREFSKIQTALIRIEEKMDDLDKGMRKEQLESRSEEFMASKNAALPDDSAINPAVVDKSVPSDKPRAFPLQH
jgi:hypothetical protein